MNFLFCFVIIFGFILFYEKYLCDNDKQNWNVCMHYECVYHGQHECFDRIYMMTMILSLVHYNEFLEKQNSAKIIMSR